MTAFQNSSVQEPTDEGVRRGIYPFCEALRVSAAKSALYTGVRTKQPVRNPHATSYRKLLEPRSSCAHEKAIGAWPARFTRSFKIPYPDGTSREACLSGPLLNLAYQVFGWQRVREHLCEQALRLEATRTQSFSACVRAELEEFLLKNSAIVALHGIPKEELIEGIRYLNCTGPAAKSTVTYNTRYRGKTYTIVSIQKANGKMTSVMVKQALYDEAREVLGMVKMRAAIQRFYVQHESKPGPVSMSKRVMESLARLTRSKRTAATRRTRH